MSDTETRTDAWQAMLDQAGKHKTPPKNPKVREAAWRQAQALEDLRTADKVQATPFNQRREGNT